MYNPQLETFLRVAEAGSFHRAAEQMYITPTAVIKQINLLEDSLEVRLFERTHRGLALTAAGPVAFAGCKVHCAILQGLGRARPQRHAGGREPDPHRHLAHDARAASDADVAQDTGALPGYPVSDSPL